MAENDNPLPQRGGFYWRPLNPSEEDEPPFADPQVPELLFDSHHGISIMAYSALSKAKFAMLDFKHSLLGTEHLLLGVLRTPDDAVSALLGRHGLSRINLRNRFEAKFVPGNAPKPKDVSLTPACMQAMKFAGEEAARLHQLPIGAEHLLLGISREGSGMAGSFLEHRKLTYQRLLGSLSSKGRHARGRMK